MVSSEYDIRLFYFMVCNKKKPMGVCQRSSPRRKVQMHDPSSASVKFKVIPLCNASTIFFGIYFVVCNEKSSGHPWACAKDLRAVQGPDAHDPSVSVKIQSYTTVHRETILLGICLFCELNSQLYAKFLSTSEGTLQNDLEHRNFKCGFWFETTLPPRSQPRDGARAEWPNRFTIEIVYRFIGTKNRNQLFRIHE
ncbi:hypothetical protein CEXT_476391, partial [Caerostris extrusa]